MSILTAVGFIVGSLFVVLSGILSIALNGEATPVTHRKHKTTTKKKERPVYTESFKTRDVADGDICWITGESKSTCCCGKCS